MSIAVAILIQVGFDHWLLYPVWEFPVEYWLAEGDHSRSEASKTNAMIPCCALIPPLHCIYCDSREVTLECLNGPKDKLLNIRLYEPRYFR